MTDQILKKGLVIIAPMLLWVPFLIYVYKSSSGIPFNDDYDMFLGSLINFENASGLYNKLTVLFSQHMEHRPAFPRMVAWLLWKLTGNCSFKILIIIGNTMLMGTTIIIAIANKKLKFAQSILLNLSFMLIVCGIQSKENIFWATGSLQNYSLIFFATAAIYASTKRKYIVAAILGLLGICCSMSGFIIIPIIILIGLYHKDFKEAFVLFGVIILIALLYNNHYKHPDLSTLPGVVLQKALIVKVKYFFAFLGSFASIKVISLHQGIIAGVIVLILTITLNLNYKNWDLWTFLSMFIILNALAGVNSRSELGAVQALSERYKIMSELLVICNIIKIFNLRFQYKTIIAALLLVVSSFVFYGQYRYHQSFVEYNKENVKIGMAVFLFQKNPLLLKYPIPLAAAERLMRAEEMHLYKIDLDD